MKENSIPRGLVPLEELFDQDDVMKKPRMVPTKNGIEYVNFGTAEKPRMVKFSKYLTLEMKGKYKRILVEFLYVFAWNYFDFKAYDTSIIQHTILVKPDQKPFHPKLRRINPRLLPSIVK